MTITLTKITHDQWFKVAKSVFWSLLSLALAFIPAIFAHNPVYLSAVVPIRGFLSMGEQLLTQEEQQTNTTMTTQQQGVASDIVDKVESELPTPPSNPPVQAQ